MSNSTSSNRNNWSWVLSLNDIALCKHKKTCRANISYVPFSFKEAIPICVHKTFDRKLCPWKFSPRVRPINFHKLYIDMKMNFHGRYYFPESVIIYFAFEKELSDVVRNAVWIGMKFLMLSFWNYDLNCGIFCNSNVY